jgi:hypothetical protein
MVVHASAGSMRWLSSMRRGAVSMHHTYDQSCVYHQRAACAIRNSRHVESYARSARRSICANVLLVWCAGHCKRMVPEFTQLGEKVSGDGKLSSRVVVAKVLRRSLLA